MPDGRPVIRQGRIALAQDATLVDDPPRLQQSVRELNALARAALTEELNGGQASRTLRPVAVDVPVTAGRDAPATAAQVRAMVAIARIRQLDPIRLLQAQHSVGRLEELRIAEASHFIDFLKRTPPPIADDGAAPAESK